MKIRIAVAVVAALAAAALLVAWRGYPVHLAVLVGVAVGALVWSVARTTDNLRSLYRGR